MFATVVLKLKNLLGNLRIQLSSLSKSENIPLALGFLDAPLHDARLLSPA
jgi:hypothetical protein